MKPLLSACALKHEAFVLALLSGMTAADAARKAGYGRKNINVRIVAWELLQREDIQKRLKELSEAATSDAVMSIIQMKAVLSEIGRACLKDYMDEHGVLKPLDKNSPNPSAIASVEYAYDPVKREAYPCRIRLHDAVDAIVELCKLDGLYKGKRVEVNVAPMTGVTVLQSARAKLGAAVAEAHEASGKASR